jgi:hypothetical protein
MSRETKCLEFCEELVGKGSSSPSVRRRAVMMTFEGWNEEEEKLVYNVVETLFFFTPDLSSLTLR